MSAPTAGLHRCRATGCDAQIVGGAAFCTEHWERIPDALQDVLVRTLNAYRDYPTPGNEQRYRQAVREAVHALEQLDGRVTAGVR